jgi:hypothetical protein
MVSKYNERTGFNISSEANEGPNQVEQEFSTAPVPGKCLNPALPTFFFPRHIM